MVFVACIRLNPSYYPVHYRMGEIHLKREHYMEALQAFESARKVNRKWEYPQYGIGLVYFAQGEIDRAREAFENITRQKKKFAPAYFKLGQVLATEGFFDDALKEYAKGSQHQAYSGQVLYELAVIFNEKDNTDGAFDYINAQLRLNQPTRRHISRLEKSSTRVVIPGEQYNITNKHFLSRQALRTLSMNRSNLTSQD